MRAIRNFICFGAIFGLISASTVLASDPKPAEHGAEKKEAKPGAKAEHGVEGLGTTYVDQHANAKFSADHIRDLTCTLDGDNVDNINSYRFASQQFSFTAPTPWIFGGTGGAGTACADGYYLMFKPLHHGAHILHYTGNFHFAIAEGDPFDFDGPIDMTYNLNVQ